MKTRYKVHNKVYDQHGNLMLRTAIKDSKVLLTLVTDGDEYDFELPLSTSERVISILSSANAEIVERIINNGE